MKALSHIRIYLFLPGLILTALPPRCLADKNPLEAKTRPQARIAEHDGQHDFDFEFGAWKAHISRLLHPLTGSHTWVQYEGSSVVRKIWDGRGNLGELEVEGPSGHIEGLSLRLYNPESHQWNISWANSNDGLLGQAMVGEFKDGRGEFFDREMYNGRAIFVRFIFSEITSDSFRLEQSFSDDGAKAWEANWIATFTRVKDKSGGGTPSAGGSGDQDVHSVPRQPRSEAWWTGPMLAASAATLPRGHFLIEPYLYDVISPHSNGFGSLTYVLYGLRDKVTVGLIPTAGFNKMNDAPSSSGVQPGDVTLMGQRGLTRFHDGSWIPATSFVVQESLPTGKYDELGDRPSDGLGSGAFTTTLAVYSQTYFWLPNGRIVRMRFNLSQALSGGVKVEGVSVYGTGTGFHGHAKPGNSSFVDAAWEYSVTRKWVLALDATYRHTENTRIAGYDPANPKAGEPMQYVVVNSGSSDAFGFAPAIEYSWKPNLGVLLGARVIAAGHNTPTTITPALAINFVR
ncbi:MAG TPA: hypothetical protein VMJ93_16520 [Verrucomicrobiae bacterium]|nr:hypothetical protein [Verrucomicrobiae bacterium]